MGKYFRKTRTDVNYKKDIEVIREDLKKTSESIRAYEEMINEMETSIQKSQLAYQRLLDDIQNVEGRKTNFEQHSNIIRYNQI